MDLQDCVFKIVAYRACADTQTLRHTDRQKIKTEPPKNLSSNIFYLQTLIIWRSKMCHHNYANNK